MSTLSGAEDFIFSEEQLLIIAASAFKGNKDVNCRCIKGEMYTERCPAGSESRFPDAVCVARNVVGASEEPGSKFLLTHEPWSARKIFWMYGEDNDPRGVMIPEVIKSE